MSDWRRRGQEKYLFGAVLVFSKYKGYRDGWDHDHSEFCNVKFSESQPDSESHGWTTEDRYHWICSGCYEDFKDEFKWR